MLDFGWLCGAFTLAYFLGSIPFGIIFTKMAGLGDMRKVGSGNIGATNVMRTGRKGLGLMTLLFDAGKGCLAIILVRYIYSDTFALLAGFFTVLGHIFPVWLHFKGGKGVATTIGVFFGIHWLLGVSVCIIWLAAFLLMRISSLASLLAMGYSPIAAYLIVGDASALLCMALAAIILATHRTNIERLLDGTEFNFRGETT